MDKKELTFSNFLSDIHPDFTPYVTAIHDKLISSGCALSLKEAKSGYVASFTHKSKKVVANFVTRKSGPQIRIYGDNYGGYTDVIHALPDNMTKAIKKSSDCKRLIDPEKCNSRCPLGYILDIGGETLKKCRYGAFMFAINEENLPHILAMLEKEIEARAV